MTLPPVCILAGGLGTRLGEHVRDTPKPLLEVAGEPFLHHQLRALAAQGADRVVVCVGYLGDQFETRLGDGSAFGLTLSYRHDGPDLRGTAGAVRGALDLLGDEFLVQYGDSYLRIDYTAVIDRFRTSGAPALMTVLRNEGKWDTSNVVLTAGQVSVYDKRSPLPEMQWIDYGLSVLTPEALRVAPAEDDLAEVFHLLAARGELAAYETSLRFFEIGTPDALAEADAFLRSVSR